MNTQPKKPKLLDCVRHAIRVRHMARSTEEAYVHWIRRFILFHNKRHPRDMDKAEVEQFLTHLAEHKHVAASTQNQALSAILFLCQQVDALAGRDQDMRRIRQASVEVSHSEGHGQHQLSRRQTLDVMLGRPSSSEMPIVLSMFGFVCPSKMATVNASTPASRSRFANEWRKR